MMVASTNLRMKMFPETTFNGRMKFDPVVHFDALSLALGGKHAKKRIVWKE